MFDQFLLVGVGGFLGAVSRFGVYQLLREFGAQLFPIATLLVNVVGSFAIGFLFQYLKENPMLNTMSLLAGVGFLGAFTTFSAFSLETVELIRIHEVRTAFMSILANLILCLIGVVVGGWLGAYLR